MNHVRRVFSLDLRSIALFRILLAMLLLADLALRSVDLTTFYTDDGVLPRRSWLLLTHRWHWSIHGASGELWWQVLLFMLAAGFAFALLFGYRSKLAAAASFILLASLLNRNGLILQGGDNLLVIMSFWAMFLPLGARYSIDAALQEAHQHNPNGLPSNAYREQPYFSVATVAIVLQVLYLYFFTALMKTGDAWTTRFDAAYYAVSLQHFATPIGDWIRQFPTLLKGATIFVLVVEFIGPLLVISPFFWPWMRLAGLLLLGSLHFAFLLMLHIGLFPLIDFMALSLLIPGTLWACLRNTQSQIARRQQLEAIVIYYDEDCAFCLKMCLILRCFLLPQGTCILPAQNYPLVHAIMEHENTWVIKDPQGKYQTQWRAMAFLFSQRWPFKPLGWLMSSWVLRGAGKRVYRWVAENRGLMGTLSSRVLPFRALKTRPTLAGSLLAGLFFYVVTSFNIYELPGNRGQMPEHVNHLARTVRLDQRWDMFAPYPLTTSSYLLIPGTLRNGEQVDLYSLTSSKQDWQTPERFYPLYESYRWRKYLGRVDGHSNNTVRSALGSYLCKSWNQQPRERETQLATLEIFVVKHRTNTQGTPKEESRHKLWRHWCYAEFADS
ncbi:HTTM domain-containing protein [Granulosicoccus antarcticus]|uniref:HTTM-like domain-containing protein n=1 Tax=Granulosicoccus antarcticus IMCC3135 TaxID=1192854 RepID=A0A2Z2P1L1_9GAMM|nr:HTTM domain-containing protein [Granulosicoccus antarcticus]ASJ74347.1 hypothetical protein IMCC3135_21350 [Granulosicoccus antarcticus IMCC3135]